VYVELLTGKRPFSGRNVRQIALQHMTEPPDLTPLPEADRAAVLRALAKEPGKRFPSCQAFVRALSPGFGPSNPVIDLGQVSEEADIGRLAPAPEETNRLDVPRPGEPPPTAVIKEA